MGVELQTYEIAYLIDPAIPEDEVFGQAGKITGFIQESHGFIGRIEEPRKKKLAYAIRKSRDAYFGWTTFTIAPERLGEIEKRVRAEPAIIRYLLVEETKRPVAEFRPRLRQPADRPLRRAISPQPSAVERVEGFMPAAPKEEDQAKVEELDKQLEEILGK